MKNGPAAFRDSGGQISYKSPPLNLNLYLLFTSTYTQYSTALKRLTQVLSFFQGKRQFTLRNSPLPQARLPSFLEISLSLDLLSLSFEELNHLWGSLGGKQLPFAVYKCRLVSVGQDRILEGGAPIQEIEIRGRAE